jgi:hypothetical protein
LPGAIRDQVSIVVRRSGLRQPVSADTPQAREVRQVRLWEGRVEEHAFVLDPVEEPGSIHLRS